MIQASIFYLLPNCGLGSKSTHAESYVLHLMWSPPDFNRVSRLQYKTELGTTAATDSNNPRPIKA